jgi:hypothetical protein
MRVLWALLLIAAYVPALRADIYECVDANGAKRFTNIKAEAKGCKVLIVSPVNTVPGPKVQTTAKPVATPANFPRVDTDTQRQRDSERRRILQQELGNEEKLLGEARKDLAAQEAVRLGSERNYQRVLERLEPFRKRVKLHEDNVSSLKRELSGIK